MIQNVNIFTEEKTFVPGAIVTQGTKIEEVRRGCGKERRTKGNPVLDGGGCYAIPGMIDMHLHGCAGYDFSDGDLEAIDEIAKYEASIGVTSICPATMTLPVKELMAALNCAAIYKEWQTRRAERMRKPKKAHEAEPVRANLVGINMEGPFISKSKKGAQDARHIIPCDVGLFREFQRAAAGLIKLIGVAPEEGGAIRFIEEVKDCVTVSVAHTAADYETTRAAFLAGAKHAVHLYNAMTGFTHREPGVVGAVFDSDEVTAELICDGVHVHPAAVRTAFRAIGANRLILISDSMRATGLPDGTYTLGGQEVFVEGRRATLKADGALAGSVTSLPDCLRRCVKEMQIPLETAVACATVNPAKCLGIDDERGVIAPGKAADIVLLDRELRLQAVMVNGEIRLATPSES